MILAIFQLYIDDKYNTQNRSIRLNFDTHMLLLILLYFYSSKILTAGFTCNVVFVYCGISAFTLVNKYFLHHLSHVCVYLCVFLFVILWDCAGKHKLRHFKHQHLNVPVPWGENIFIRLAPLMMTQMLLRMLLGWSLTLIERMWCNVHVSLRIDIRIE